MNNLPSKATLMPECEGRNVCINFCGLVTEKDFDGVFLAAVRKALATHPDFNAVMYFSNHLGWEEKAAELSFNSFHNLGQHARRIAYVNPPPGKILHVKLFEHCINAEIRTFPEEELQRAIGWAKTGAD